MNRHLGITLFGDAVRARLTGGGLLPRIPATRADLPLDGNWSAWEGKIEWLQTGRHNRVGQFKTGRLGENAFHGPVFP